MRVSFHLSGTRAQYVRDRFSAFRLVQLLHGTFVKQEDRDLLEERATAIISLAHERASERALLREFIFGIEARESCPFV